MRAPDGREFTEVFVVDLPSRLDEPGDDGPLWARVFGFVALILASVNIFGGFMVTERMLSMYKKKG